MSLNPSLPNHSFCYYWHPQGRHFALPLVSSAAETKIRTTSSRTVLKQTFVNVDHDAIQQCSYQFPLYDGATIVGFRCFVGGKEITGVVKEREEARSDFDAAVAQGQTASLLEQSQAASDVFRTSIGNVPKDSTVVVEITYVSELKHDTESDGIRFEMPTKVAPRYGGDGAGSRVEFHHLWYNCFPDRVPNEGSFTWTAKIQLSEPISNVQSPSHPVSVSLGRLELDGSDVEPSLKHCRVEMSIPQSAGLSSELILIVKAKGTKEPLALLETHETMDEQRALMVTLVPNFALQPIRPEVVFVCDRSGSMQGSHQPNRTAPIQLAADALKILLHSLPPGIKFNVCSFGSRYEFLFPKSQSLSKESLQQAMLLVSEFRANFGGTETHQAIKATVDNRYGDIPLDIILLTDGDIWQQENLMHYITSQVSETKGQIRIFPLGIGSGVSSALIEGVARAGNGFAQMAMEGERMENRCVRMLKAAMSPHINDYRLQVEYEEQSDDNSDFELVEKPEGALNLPIRTASKDSTPPQKRKVVSLFDPDIDADNLQESKGDLPKVTVPKILQAPFNLPALYAFSRTTAYLMLSPDAVRRKPKAVVLCGTADAVDLRLEIPVHDIGAGTTVHQLAARKAAQDLEEGRSWLHETEGEESLQTKHPSSFGDLVKAEAVRLGTTYQVMNRWCSFVAVDTKSKQQLNTSEPRPMSIGGATPFQPAHRLQSSMGTKKRARMPKYHQFLNSSQPVQGPLSPALMAFHSASYGPSAGSNLFGQGNDNGAPLQLFSAPAPAPQQIGVPMYGMPTHPSASSPCVFTSSMEASEAAHPPPRPSTENAVSLFGASQQTTGEYLQTFEPFGATKDSQRVGRHVQDESALNHRQRRRAREMSDARSTNGSMIDEDVSKLTPMARLHRIISLQDFEGFWSAGDTSKLQELIGMSDSESGSDKTDVWITTLVIDYLEMQMADQRDVWELVVEKARNWLGNQASHVS